MKSLQSAYLALFGLGAAAAATTTTSKFQVLVSVGTAQQPMTKNVETVILWKRRPSARNLAHGTFGFVCAWSSKSL